MIVTTKLDMNPMHFIQPGLWKSIAILCKAKFILSFGDLEYCRGYISIIEYFPLNIGLKMLRSDSFITLRPRQNGRHFTDDIFKHIFLNENVWIPIKISLKFVAKGLIVNILALVQIMAWRRPGDKHYLN